MRGIAFGVFNLAAGVMAALAADPVYRIEARINGETISGRIEIRHANPTGRMLDRIPIELPPGTDRTRFGDNALSRGGTEIVLAKPLPSDGEIRLSGDFKARLPRDPDLGYRWSSEWYPRLIAFTGNRLDRKERLLASFQVTLEVPSNEVVAGSGRLESRELLPDGFQRLRFAVEPISSFGIAASPRFRKIQRDAGGVTVEEYQVPENAEWNGKGFADAAVQVINFYHRTFSEYPHSSLAILPGAPRATGGNASAGNMIAVHMNMQSTSKGFERWIIAHEIGDMLWRFETVLDAEREGHWLGLGLGLYTDRLYTESLPDFPTEFQRNLIDQYLGLVANGKNTRFTDGTGTVNHGKGLAVIQMLEQLAGPERADYRGSSRCVLLHLRL